MAARDKQFYDYLVSALRYKAKNPDAQYYGNYRYEPFIYKWARRSFPQFYNNNYGDNAEYTRHIVEALNRGEPELVSYMDGSEEQNDEFHDELREELITEQAESKKEREDKREEKKEEQIDMGAEGVEEKPEQAEEKPAEKAPEVVAEATSPQATPAEPVAENKPPEKPAELTQEELDRYIASLPKREPFREYRPVTYPDEALLGDVMKADSEYQGILAGLENGNLRRVYGTDDPAALKAMPLQQYMALANTPQRTKFQGEKHSLAEKRFRELYPDKANDYDKQERTRVYNRPSEDPAIAKVEETIKFKVANRSKPMAGSSVMPNRDAITNLVSWDEWDSFIARYPEKVRAYAQTHPGVKWALEGYQKRQEFKKQQALEEYQQREARVRQEQEIWAKQHPNEVRARLGIEPPKPVIVGAQEIGAKEEPKREVWGKSEVQRPLWDPRLAYNDRAVETETAPIYVSSGDDYYDGGYRDDGGGGGFNYPRPSIRNILNGGRGRAAGAGRAAGRVGGKLAARGAMLAGRALLMTPAGWVVIVAVVIVLILLLVVPVLMTLLNQEALLPGALSSKVSAGPISTESGGLKLSKSADKSEAAEGDTVTYSLSVSYSGKGKANIEVTDNVPPKTEFVSADSEGAESGGVVTWKVDQLAAGESKTVSFTVTTLEDAWLQNTASAKVTGTSGGGGGGGTGTPIDPGSIVGISDFNTLMKGQGRNTNVLGDADTFTATVLGNGGSYLAGKESQVRIIYKEALEKNVNPLAVLAIWGTETGFKLELQDKALSCPVRESTTFQSQARCAAKTYDFWMRDFEQRNSGGSLAINSKCVYDDPFIYATEKYGPTCVIYDGNDFFLKNFVLYYKKFSGAE